MKFFWSKIETLVTNSFIEAFDSGELSYTQKQGVITLLLKGNELDKEDLNNWLPITLTNTDYKILAKVLAERLSGAILKLVNEDQAGYIRDKKHCNSYKTIDDVINHLNRTKMNQAIFLWSISGKHSTPYQKLSIACFQSIWVR